MTSPFYFSIMFNMTTRKYQTTHVACIVCLLDSADLAHLGLHDLEAQEDKLRGDLGDEQM